MNPFEGEETEKLKAGIRLFQEGYYFEAHDEWEEVWQELRGRKRLFWQSLIQISVACYHIENGNLKGAAGMVEKASQKISKLQSEHQPPILLKIRFLIDQLSLERDTQKFSDDLKKLFTETITDELILYS